LHRISGQDKPMKRQIIAAATVSKGRLKGAADSAS